MDDFIQNFANGLDQKEKKEGLESEMEKWIEEIPELREMYGRYAGFDRKEGLFYFINDIENLSRIGKIPDKHPLYCTKGFAKNLRTISNAMNDYVEERRGYKMREQLDSSDIQGFINLKKLDGEGEENSLKSVEQYVFRVQKVNLYENFAYGTQVDYSSTLTYEEPTSKPRKDIRNVMYKPEDAEKLIKASHKEDYNKNTDTAVAIDLVHYFMIRLDTTMKLTLENIDLKKMEIRIPGDKNKGKVAYTVKAETDEEKEVLRQIVIRAENKYYKLVDNAKNIPITTTKEKGMHIGFRRYEEKAGIGDFYRIKNTSYHAMRKATAQRKYDEIRETKMNMPPLEARAETLREVAKLLGHGKNIQKTLNSYIFNAW